MTNHKPVTQDAELSEIEKELGEHHQENGTKALFEKMNSQGL